ncbi:hypothetical protein ACH5RR_026051 [Cinchona calisaya]|uniref:Uncharacterized protein n=1 Tax=Cinchona calisaya TaxID=153742 RepID=A0ABD2Z2I0_9GENT
MVTTSYLTSPLRDMDSSYPQKEQQSKSQLASHATPTILRDVASDEEEVEKEDTVEDDDDDGEDKACPSGAT